MARKGIGARIARALLLLGLAFVVASALAVLVPVPAGADPATLLLRLKDAGFEAWPVF